MPDPASIRLSYRDVIRRFDRLTCAEEFDALARATRAYQKERCTVYRRYAYEYLPIAAFKHAPVTSFPPEEAVAVFESSGTGTTGRSRHYVRDLSLYDRSAQTHFASVFGRGPFTLVAHLPGYAPQSSLVHMVWQLIAAYGDEASGFFLEDPSLLERAIAHSRALTTPLILFGAAFGLLQLAATEQWRLPPSAIVIETGGMKTYRQHVTRDELHRRLAQGFGVDRQQVRSEYGMCELLSQSYTRGGSLFYAPKWMRVDAFDPAEVEHSLPEGVAGVLGVIDLANIHTVSAIMTEDLGVCRGGGFEVLGRLSASELRGCNFLVEDV